MHNDKPAYFNKETEFWLYSTKSGDWLFDNVKYGEQKSAKALPANSDFDCPNSHSYESQIPYPETGYGKGRMLNPSITVEGKYASIKHNLWFSSRNSTRM